MNPASPEAEPTDAQQHRGTRSLDPHHSSFPISELPSELLSLVLRYSLPEFDALESTWEYDDCQPYMARLFSLRHVSTLWRDLIDSTPSLWTLISSTWSPEAIKMVLRRSGTCPLVIHHLPPDLPDDPDRDEVEFGREFYRLVDPHRLRWAVAIIALPLELVSEFFDKPIPHLDAIRLTLTDDEALKGPAIPLTPTITDVLGNLEHVHFNCVPFQWNEVLGRFKGLKTLGLSLLRGHGITAEQISNAISINPTLEKIVLAAVEAEAPPMPVDWAFSNPARTTLPRLRVLQVEGSLYLLDTILRNIRIVHELDELAIVAAPSESPRNNRYFWMKTVSPLFPTLRRIHKTNGSSVALEEGGPCVWAANVGDDTHFNLSIDGLGHATILEWIASVVEAWGDAEGDLPGFRVMTTSTPIDVPSTLSALKTIRGVTSIHVNIGSNGVHPWRLLEALGGTAYDPPTGPPPFPFLEHLRLRNWKSNFDKLIEAVKRRYTTHQPKGWRPRSDLRLDLTTSKPVWFENRSPVIIHLEKALELREQDGVESVRLGCLKEQPGMLAVVLNEEEGRLAWG